MRIRFLANLGSRALYLTGSNENTCYVPCRQRSAAGRSHPSQRRVQQVAKEYLFAPAARLQDWHEKKARKFKKPIKSRKKYQGWGSGFGQKPDPGLCTSKEGRFLKVLKPNILDNFKSLLFCFHTLGVRRTIDVLDSENQPGIESVQIRTGSGSGALWLTVDIWHQKYENKKEGV